MHLAIPISSHMFARKGKHLRWPNPHRDILIMIKEQTMNKITKKKGLRGCEKRLVTY